MTPIPWEKEALFPRMDGMQKNIKKLEKLSRLSFQDFCKEDNYDLAQHHLRLALEGVFNISSHILSRLPGGRAVAYKDMAVKMGECGVIPKDFVNRALIPMAGMRNVLVHHYAEMEAKRLYEIVCNHREDIETFLKHIRDFLQNLKSFQLEMS